MTNGVLKSQCGPTLIEMPTQKVLFALNEYAVKQHIIKDQQTKRTSVDHPLKVIDENSVSSHHTSGSSAESKEPRNVSIDLSAMRNTGGMRRKRRGRL